MINIERKKAIFFPAIGPQFISYWEAGQMYKGFDLKHFTDKSFFTYPYALASAYFALEKQWNTFRKDTSFPDPPQFRLMGDSGGFQASSFGARPNPISVLRWLEGNCDYAMNLDIPYAQNVKELPTQLEFDKSLNESVENFKLFEKYRENYKCKFYNVLHGESWDYMNKWYNSVKDFKFDSWAIGLKPQDDIYIQILGFSYLLEKGALENVDGLHFLGMSGNKIIPIMAYIAKKYLPNKLITFDSSSYNGGSLYREYFYNHRSDSLYFGEAFSKNNWVDTLPCHCPVCRNLTIDEMNSPNNFISVVICLHNLWHTIQFTNMCNCYVSDLQKLKDALTGYTGSINEIEKGIDFVDYCVRKGTEEGFKYMKSHTYKRNTQARLIV